MITLAIAFALHLAYAEYVSQYILFAILGLPLLSLLLTVFAVFFVRVELGLPEKAPVNAPVTLEVRITNRYFLPLARLSLTLNRQNLFTGESEPPQRLLYDACVSETRPHELSGAHCGRCQVQVTRMGLYDYLGLFRFPLRKPAPAAYLSMPKARAPVPPFSLTDLIPKRMTPKPGGGFAEEHELRPYRDGDSVSAIHWKLSSKLDELVIREPMIPQKQQIYLILEPCATPEELDSVLGQLLYVSRELLSHDIPHTVKCPFTRRQQLMSADIAGEQALKGYVSRLLTSRVSLTNGETPAPVKTAGHSSYMISPKNRKGETE